VLLTINKGDDMKSSEAIKNVVKEKYAEIAKKPKTSGCCGSGCCCDSTDYNVCEDDASNLKGYVADADLGLGCGLPTEYAGIKKGDTVVDLGSGAGNDVFIARAATGDKGKVIGIDMTDEMIRKANRNNARLGYHNVEFKLGDIENMPIDDNVADVVVSNCVLNLVPDKKKAFSEMVRILKPGAHFCISDVVIKGKMTEELKKSAALYTGCISGALDQNEYLALITNAGFKNVTIKKSKQIELPDEFLKEHLTSQGIENYKKSLHGIFSITVVGYK